MRCRPVTTPRPLASSLARFSSAAAMLAALAMAGSTAAKAATLQWDPNGNTDAGATGGTGTWDNVATNLSWLDGAANVAWPNTDPGNVDEAVFGGTAGTVTLGVPIFVNKLTFNVGGYTISNGGTATNTLTLSGATPTISITNSPDTATISAIIAGSAGLTKAGAGTLTLSGVNTFTGGVFVNSGTLSVSADANLGAVANGLTLAGGTLSTGGTFTSARTVTLGTGGGTFDVTGTGALTLSTGLAANANALIKTGTGTLTLSAASTRTGTTAINGGTVTLGNVGALGTGAATVNAGGTLAVPITANATLATPVTLNGGTFSIPSGAFTLSVSQPLTVNSASTINITGAHPSKLLLAASQLTGAGNITRTGSGTLQISGANSGFTGNWVLNGGVVEVGNAASMGSGTVSVNTGGEIALNAVTFGNSVTLNGGTISSNAATGATFSGPINVAGNSNVALRFFQTTSSGSTFTLAGPLSGTGNLNVSAPNAQTLIVNGNISGYTGNITLGNNASLALRTANSTLATLGSPGLNAYYYNFGSNPTASGNPTVYATDMLALEARVFTRIDANPNLPLIGGTSTNTYPVTPVPGFQYNVNDGAMWKGLLNITTAGTYQFSSAVDDQDILFIDGVQVGAHSSNTGGSFTNIGNAITLSAGAHSIVYKFSQGSGGGYNVLRYSGPDSGNNAVTIPDSAFTTGSLAPIELGAVTANGGNTLTINSPTRTSSLSIGNNVTFSVASETIDDLTVTGATTLNGGTATINANSGAIIFNGAIGQSTASNVSFGGGYLKVINAPSTYTGTTTVTAGELDLNASGGNAIPGDLTLNVATSAATANVNNINLKRSDQIADFANVTLSAGAVSNPNVGILNLGAFNETVATLSMNGGRITGAGTLTLGNLTGSTFTGGSIEAALGGSGTFAKTGSGTLVLSGANTYTGVTNISAGALLIRNGAALGATGAGNDTTIGAAGNLQILGSLALGEDIISSNGTGIRILGGNSTDSGKIVYGSGVANATLTVNGGAFRMTGPTSIDGTASNTNLTIDGNGELIINSPIALGSGTLARSGNGTLTFAYDTAGTIPVTHNSGAIGFSGTQTGTFTVPVDAKKAYKFNTDPGAGASIAAAAGSTVIAGFAPNQTFLSRFTAGSAGNLVLTTDTSSNLDLSAGPNITLGARGLVSYSGTITPNGGAYNFGGTFGGGDSLQNILALTQPLTGTNALNVTAGGALDLTRTSNTFSGAVSINGGTVIFTNGDDLGNGAATNGITLSNGGTLRIAQTSGNSGSIYSDLGYNTASGTVRTLTIGTGGGTIDVPALGAGNNGFTISQANALQGAAGATLTKTGLGVLYVTNSNSFAGDLVIGPLGNQVDLRGAGALPNVSSITINQSSTLNLNSFNSLAVGRAIFAAQNIERINNGASITLAGGGIFIKPPSTTTTTETFGALTLKQGQATFNADTTVSSDVQNGQVVATFASTTHNVGSSIRFGGSGPSYGAAAGNNSVRVTLGNVNGSAVATGQILSFAYAFGTDVLTMGANGLVIPSYTAQGTGAFAPVATTVYNLNGNGTATLSAGTGGVISINTLHFGPGDFGQTLDFATGTDTLYLGASNSFGGAITSAAPAPTAARTITIGNAAGNGKITAGPATGATGTQELFFHFRGNNGGSALTMNVNSTIVDNNANAAVALVKDDDGTIQLQAANTYSGGTYLNRGRINTTIAGALGSGAVNVKNSALQVGVPGAVTTGTSTPSADKAVYTVTDQSELYLSSTTAAYTAATDRFDIQAGAMITSPTTGAGLGLNSLSYIAPGTDFTAGGQIRLEPGAIIRSNSVVQNSDVGTLNMIKNLPNDASFYLNVGSTAGDATTLSLGAGTPWKGLASGKPGATWTAGTIFANSDFELQGTTTDNAVSALVLGSNGTGTYSIVNTAGKPINALVTGTVQMNEGSPVSMPSDLTFVVSNGATLQPNVPNQFGSGSNVAKILVQAGGTLDPGAYAAVGTVANQPQGFVYPVPGPINASQTLVESGGRLLVNDASGLGASPVGSIQLKSGAVLDIGNSQAFLGSNAGLINVGQIVYDPGVIVRLNSDSVFRLNQFVLGAPNGDKAVIEIAGNNRNVTDAVNPMIVAATGTPQIEIQDLTISYGQILTNDASDRQINERRGNLVLNDGAILAATNQSYFNIQEGIRVAPNATITIGSNQIIDGVPKLGAIRLSGPQSNAIPASATINMLNGTQLAFGANNVWPDATGVNLPLAVTSFLAAGASSVQPGNGTSLLLDTANFVEVVGPLTGNGAVIANQGNAAIASGWGATTDFTSNVVFKSTNGQNPSFMKTGPTKMTLTGVSDSTGEGAVQQGELALSGTGTTKFNFRVQKGATLTIDNSTAALNNRTGTPSFWIPAGGTFNLIGNETTPVTETVQTLANGTGNFANAAQVGGLTFLNVTPGAATTKLNVWAAENFQTSGQRTATWVLRSPSVGNQPGTYAANGTYTASASNTSNGLISIQNPNFVNNAAFGTGSGGILGSPGTPLVSTRPDYLGDISATGQGTGFMTEDGAPFLATNTSGSNQVTVPSAAGLSVGQMIAGNGIPLGTTITAISGTTLTLSANTTAANTNGVLTAVGSMRLLTASEYASSFRDNMNTNVNVKLSGTTTTSGDTRFTTLTLTPGSTLNISGTLPLNMTPSRLHLNGAGIFVQSGGTATINGGDATNYLQANTGAGLFLHTQGDLNLNATVFSDLGIIKTGSGTLNVAPGAFNAFRGTLQIDGGTVNLAPGNSFTNKIQQSGFLANNNLYLNSGTLNLNGNSQMINTLYSDNDLAGMGGTVTSATPATLTVVGGGRFSGTIAGKISLDKPANNTLLLTNDNTYTGGTLIRAGTLTLRDSGKLSGTSSVDVNYGTLQLDNSYLANVTNRIPATTPVTLRGGTLNVTGAANQLASQTLNTLTLQEGLNSFTGNSGGGGAVEINIGNLVRPAGSGAIVNFNANYGFLGVAGNDTTTVRAFVTNLNGTSLALNDGIIGGWATASSNQGGNGNIQFATYRPTVGVGAMGNTGDGFAAYSSSDITAAGANDNVQDTATGRTLTASKTINSLRAAMTGNATYTFNNGVGLTIDTGGFISDANATLSLSSASNAVGNFITSNSGELDVWVQQNTSGINVPITGGIDFVKSGGATLNVRPEGSLTITNNTSGTNAATVSSAAGLAVGMPVSGTGIPAGTTIASISGTNITLSKNTTAAVTTMVPVFGNSYTGKTIVNGGTLTLNQGAAGDGTAYLAIPGDLFIQGPSTVVTEANVANQINKNASVTLAGGGRLNMVSAAGVTETLKSITFADGASSTGTSNVDRATTQPSSTLLLSAPIAVTVNNSNSQTGVPFFGGFLGNVGFTNATGATLQVDSPVTVNGNAAVGLRIGSAIADVPTGVAEGGLIKSGTGLLVLGPDQNVTNATNTITAGSNTITSSNTLGLTVGMPISGTGIPAGSFITSITPNTSFTISQNATAAGTNVSLTGNMVNFNKTAATYDGTLASLTDVFNIAQGYVRVDANAALGSNSANTAVQNGAVLLGSNSSGTVLTGSVELKNGATLGATINGFTLGNATKTVVNQSVLNIPSGTVNIAAYDYFIPTTNAGNITINSRLTGAGNINITGPQVTGAAGTITLGNPLLSGSDSGQNDYSGTITVGANAILANQVALVSGITTRTTGNALGSASINLNGGRLRLRDDLSGTADVSNQAITYGNNVTLLADSFLDANRQTSTSAANNTINLGTLTIPSGAKGLTVDSTNGYAVGFSAIDGAGSLVKGGTGRLNIGSIAAGFSGSITIAGPMGYTVAPSFSTSTNPNISFATTATLPNFNVNGSWISEASKTLNVSGAFAVNANPGNVGGMLAVTNTSTLNAVSFVNNGQVGSIGGSATITASGGFSGSGHYVTNGQALNLAGSFASGALRIAGNNTVSVTGSSLNLTAGGEVQSGTLRIAPAAGGGTSSGNIRVFGSPAATASSTSAPISAVNGTLQFDSGTESVTHTGNITNNGIVQVKSGTTTVEGVIAGTPTEYVPGLLEGFTTAPGGSLDVSTARAANPGNFGVRLEPRMLQTNAVTQQALTGHTDNDTWIYTGYVKDDDGVFSFAENIDDRAAVWVDGQLVLNAANGGTSRVVSTAFSFGQATASVAAGANLGNPSQNFGPGISLPGRGDGWHLVEIRMNNGTGGSGPITGNGFGPNYGFGYKNGIAALDGADMIKPVDNGTGNLFVTPVGGSGKIDIAANASLKTQGFKLISSVTLNGGSAALEVTGAGANDTDAIVSNGGTVSDPNKLTLAAGANVAAGNLTVATGGAFRLAGSATSSLSIGGSAIDGALELDGGVVMFTGTSTGSTGVVNVKSGAVSVSVGGSLKGSLAITGGSVDIAGNGVLATSGFVDGGLTQSAGQVNVGGVVVGDVAVSGGTFKGDGAILGALSVTGGILAPGNTLQIGDLGLQAAAKLSIEIGGSPASSLNDQLVVGGGVSLAGELQGSLLNGFTPHNGDTFYIILNDGADPVVGTFQGLAQNSVVNFGGFNWAVTYTANGDGGSIGNDVALIAQVPEPNSAATLVAALGALTGLQRFRRRRS